ncbi:unnamed protein product [Closterium sp. NIES-65]|nr:unnamed protein product [Closterium sp. NIES-65]
MVCKRLLHHVASFPVSLSLIPMSLSLLPVSLSLLPVSLSLLPFSLSLLPFSLSLLPDLEPMTLPINPQDPSLTRPSGALSLFLRHAPHTPLNVLLNSSQDLHCLGRLLGPSARSLTNLSLGLREAFERVEPIMRELQHLGVLEEFVPMIDQNQPMNPAVLEEFQQLHQLNLDRGIWQLGKLNPASFGALRSLSVHDFECGKKSLSFLSSVTPQLHELALAASNKSSGFTTVTLDFKLTAARSITVCFDHQSLHLRFALPASLKAFSATALVLNVDCTCNSRLSLDSLSLIGYSQLLVSSLPLAAAKSVYLNGGASTQEDQWRAFPGSNLEPHRTVTNLLSRIAPTVEELVLRYGWPLEGVRVEWSRLRCVFVGIDPHDGSGGGSGGHLACFYSCGAVVS